MGLLSWIVLGLIAGAIVKHLMPVKAPGGIVATIVLGILGALVGGEECRLSLRERALFRGAKDDNLRALTPVRTCPPRFGCSSAPCTDHIPFPCF
jgi:hypothetical protein